MFHLHICSYSFKTVEQFNRAFFKGLLLLVEKVDFMLLFSQNQVCFTCMYAVTLLKQWNGSTGHFFKGLLLLVEKFDFTLLFFSNRVGFPCMYAVTLFKTVEWFNRAFF